MRAGIGYDVHKLIRGRPLVLGGVEIAHEKGLDGNSDADVLLHAIMDSILGAMGKGDIGIFFPPDDPTYKDVSSMILLENVGSLMVNEGWGVGNIDAVIVAQAPKMSRHIPEMRKNISTVLEVNEERINIKATTTEGLGFTGSSEGIAAYAVTMLFSA